MWLNPRLPERHLDRKLQCVHLRNVHSTQTTHIHIIRWYSRSLIQWRFIWRRNATGAIKWNTNRTENVDIHTAQLEMEIGHLSWTMTRGHYIISPNTWGAWTAWHSGTRQPSFGLHSKNSQIKIKPPAMIKGLSEWVSANWTKNTHKLLNSLR